MAQLKCPNCSREFVRRISRSGLVERLISLVYIYPFKCQICGFRFRMSQWGVRYVRVDEDHREYYRTQVKFPLTFHDNDLNGKGTALNISMGGCSFTTLSQVTMGMILQLGLQIADDVPPVEVEAAMVRYVTGESVGVEFLRWREGERERLQLFVRGLLIGHPS